MSKTAEVEYGKEDLVGVHARSPRPHRILDRLGKDRWRVSDGRTRAAIVHREDMMPWEQLVASQQEHRRGGKLNLHRLKEEQALQRIALLAQIITDEAGKNMDDLTRSGADEKWLGYARPYGPENVPYLYDVSFPGGEVRGNIRIGTGIPLAEMLSSGVPLRDNPGLLVFWGQNVGSAGDFRAMHRFEIERIPDSPYFIERIYVSSQEGFNYRDGSLYSVKMLEPTPPSEGGQVEYSIISYRRNLNHDSGEVPFVYDDSGIRYSLNLMGNLAGKSCSFTPVSPQGQPLPGEATLMFNL